MAGGVINSQNSNLLSNKDVDGIFFNTLSKHSPEYTAYTKPMTSQDRYIKEGEMSELGPLKYKAEGAEIETEIFKQGSTKQITFKDYAMATPITRQARQYDRHGVISRIAQMQANASLYAKELNAIQLFTDAIAGTYRTAIDGQPLLDDAHTILNPYVGASSATFDNLLTAQTLGAAALTEIRDYFEEIKNSLGLPAMIPGQIVLYIPTGLRDTARLHLDNEYEVDAADRNLNLNKDAMTYKVLHYLDKDSTAYFAIHTGMNPLMHITSMGLEPRMWYDEKTRNQVYSVVEAYADDFYSTYGICGSAGA